MRSENMSKSLLTAYHITNILSPYRKSWSINTMVTAVFRPEAVLMLFLHMRSENVSKCRVPWCRISTTWFHL